MDQHTLEKQVQDLNRKLDLLLQHFRVGEVPSRSVIDLRAEVARRLSVNQTKKRPRQGPLGNSRVPGPQITQNADTPRDPRGGRHHRAGNAPGPRAADRHPGGHIRDSRPVSRLGKTASEPQDLPGKTQDIECRLAPGGWVHLSGPFDPRQPGRIQIPPFEAGWKTDPPHDQPGNPVPPGHGSLGSRPGSVQRSVVPDGFIAVSTEDPGDPDDGRGRPVCAGPTGWKTTAVLVDGVWRTEVE